jgi:hypothetical protein
VNIDATRGEDPVNAQGPSDANAKRDELALLRARVEQLQSELSADTLVPQEALSRDYPAYYATVGFALGIFGAAASLLFNVIGSLIAGKNPLELVRVYLTFPLGGQALRLSEHAGVRTYAVGDGLIIAMGCTLYLATGMLLGVPVTLALAKLTPRGALASRLIVASLAALAIWAVNFYGILSWLQPMLFGGRWIVDNARLPWWVAAATHLVFGWTIALLYPFARPYVASPPPTAG